MIREIEEDHEGNLLVPLGRTEHWAIIEPQSYRFLLDLGLSPHWQCTPKGYVFANGSNGKKVSVARVLLDAKAGEEMTYRDGNPLNLTRSNLEVIASRKAIKRDRDFVENRSN